MFAFQVSITHSFWNYSFKIKVHCTIRSLSTNNHIVKSTHLFSSSLSSLPNGRGKRDYGELCNDAPIELTPWCSDLETRQGKHEQFSFCSNYHITPIEFVSHSNIHSNLPPRNNLIFFITPRPNTPAIHAQIPNRPILSTIHPSPNPILKKTPRLSPQLPKRRLDQLRWRFLHPSHERPRTQHLASQKALASEMDS